MLVLKSNNIKDFPFELYAGLNDSQLEDLAKEHFLTSHNSWMLPQIAAHYGNWELVTHPGSNKIDSIATAKKNISVHWDIGLWKVVTKLKRGSLVKSQVNPEFASYSALVPLIMMGAKKYKGIGYNQWDIDPESRLVDKNLLEAMFWQPDERLMEFDITEGEIRYGLGSKRLLELRKQGLTVKSGPKKGSLQSPTSAWCLRGMQGTELANAPKLVGTMLTQIWVAHPSLRTEYMILDPNDWDLLPPPLIDIDIFNGEVPATPYLSTTNAVYDLPWETA